MKNKNQKANITGGVSDDMETEFLTSAAVSKSAPGVVDEEWTHFLH